MPPLGHQIGGWGLAIVGEPPVLLCSGDERVDLLLCALVGDVVEEGLAASLLGEEGKARVKVKQLEKYGSDDARLVFFCRCQEPGDRDGVRFVSVEGEVMGWILSDPRYAEAMWDAGAAFG